MEDKDILGQIKPKHPKGTKKLKKGNFILILFGLIMIYFVGDLIFGDNRMTTLFSDGKSIQSKGNFNKMGNAIGKHTEYRKDGSKKMEVNYDNLGKLHGEYLFWNSKGQLISSSNYIHGLLNGESKRWNNQNELIEHEIYRNDSLIKKIK